MHQGYIQHSLQLNVVRLKQYWKTLKRTNVNILGSFSGVMEVFNLGRYKRVWEDLFKNLLSILYFPCPFHDFIERLV